MSTFAQFIEHNVDAVVDEFEAFARSNSPANTHFSSVDLRDHARVLLLAFAADMTALQSAAQRHEKSVGRDPKADFSQVCKTSRQHAQHRFTQGFTLPQMVAEYRALRASVIRRWVAQVESADAGELEELTRFGEAVDEGLTESIDWYSKRLDDSRNLLIGVLAHDLRAPLTAVRMSAEYLMRPDHLQDGELRAVTRIVSSVRRMGGYVSDLLDFTRTLLGAGLPVNIEPMNLGALALDVIDELRAAPPTFNVVLDIQQSRSGSWDPLRLSQVFSNLVTNAIVHGDPAHPVTVTLSEQGGDVVLAVHNKGPAIPPDALPTLFQPLMQQGDDRQRPQGSSGLGLGLYIAREIAVAHGGTLEADSNAEAGTTFTMKLPLVHNGV